MKKHITAARQDTEPVLEEAAALTTQKEEAEMKQKLLNAFSARFILSEDDIQALTSTVEPVDDRFFRVLGRTKQVHKDCEVLLGGENQRLGMEIMEQSSKNLNAAFMKLYKWIQKEFKSLNLEDPQINSSIRRGLRVLAERPSLFHSCLDFFAEAREYILSDAFHQALTAAISNDVSDVATKPIEFSAHDPLRYVGDMLAWVHSATVSEREALEALFVSDGNDLAKGIEAGIQSEPWSRPEEGEETVFDGQKALTDLVTRDLSGVSRSLRQRVELVIQGHDDLVTVYKVMNLLAFYETTFRKLIGLDSDLVETIVSLQRSTFQRFEFLVQEHLAAVSADVHGLAPPADLGVPEYLTESLNNLTQLMKAYDSSFGHEVIQTNDQNENQFTPIISIALDPFYDLARSAANELSDPNSKLIFETNCLLAVRSTISPYEFACTTHLDPLSSTLATLRANLLEVQHKFLLHESGLNILLHALQPFTPSDENRSKPPTTTTHTDLSAIASLPEFQPEALSTSSQQLDDFLPSALVDATDNLERLHSPSLVKSVTEEAVEIFARDFEFVESMVLGADEAHENERVESGRSEKSGVGGDDDDEEEDGEKWSLRVLFPRTTGEIRVLLS